MSQAATFLELELSLAVHSSLLNASKLSPHDLGGERRRGRGQRTLCARASAENRGWGASSIAKASHASRLPSASANPRLARNMLRSPTKLGIASCSIFDDPKKDYDEKTRIEIGRSKV
jgi:hypothetical protein